MPELSVHVDEAIVVALQKRAERSDRSEQEELRAILEEALSSDVERLTFKDLLAQMPNVGEDDDFHAPRGPGEVSK